MKKTKNLRKRIIAVVLSTILCLASSTTAFANSEANIGDTTSVESGVAAALAGDSTRAISTCIASDGIITNGYGGELVLHLDKSYFNIYVRAGATGNENNAVDCFVTFPNGTTYPLGFVVADGSKTSYLYYSGTAPAGDYIFTFEGTDEGTTGFLGFIYSSN